MKNKLAIAICCIAALAVVASTKIQKHEVVILKGTTSSQGGLYTGLDVYCSSSSAGAPKFPHAPSAGPATNLVPMAEAIAALLDEGYAIEHISPNAFDCVMVKK